MLRILLAATFAIVGIVATALLLGFAFQKGVPALLSIPAAAAGMLAIHGLAVWLFNPKGTVFLPWTTREQRLAYLRKHDLLEESEFFARRAFGVAEEDDEGPHYYLELEDGSVLYLVGQYLYEHEAIHDDPELYQERQFPCTHFVTRRHRKERYVEELVCLGSAFEPEATAPEYSAEAYQAGLPNDGDVLTVPSYEELRERRMLGR